MSTTSLPRTRQLGQAFVTGASDGFDTSLALRIARPPLRTTRDIYPYLILPRSAVFLTEINWTDDSGCFVTVSEPDIRLSTDVSIDHRTGDLRRLASRRPRV